jgi:hypothetical protein
LRAEPFVLLALTESLAGSRGDDDGPDDQCGLATVRFM